MIKSLRWRVQLWYGIILLGVVVSFATILFYRVRTTKEQEIDAQLESAALYLDASLRSFPFFELEADFPEPPKKFMKKPFEMEEGFDMKKGPKGWPKDKKKGEFFPPPPKKPREQLLAELDLPRGPMERVNMGGERPYFAIWRADGSVLKHQDMPDAQERGPLRDEAILRPVWSTQGDYREIRVRGPGRSQILVGRSIAREQEELQTLGWQLLGIGAGVLVVGLAGGWVLASRIVRPIAAMSATASSISAKRLSERIDASKVDTELSQLADVLNAMFARLESAFARQQRFTADASHELRTPLAILRSHAELALNRPRSPEEYRQTIETCLRAANRMNALVQGLLTLARLDGVNPEENFRVLALGPLIEECVTLFQPLADEKKIQLTAELSPADVTGDPDAIVQVLSNLLHNAIHHTPAQGTISVHLSVRDGMAEIRVTDTGDGIPEEHRAHIFERFYRVDKARSREAGGAGLGLAICKGIVEAHQGTIRFESESGRGTTFRVRLPLAA